MILRLIGAVLALATIATYCFLPKKRVSSEVPTRESSRISALFLASALTLFVELALIRWVATEIRIFAYAKNLALLLCFLGFGLGCALARETPRWRATAGTLLALILVVRFPWFSEQLMENLSRYLGAGRHLDVWATGPERHWELFLLGSAVSLVLFFLLTYIFIPLGQKVSREIEVSERPLLGYSWNLAGSLVGILAFFGVSWMALPPAVWFAIVLAGIAVLQPPGKERILIGFAIIPAIFLLLSPATAHHFNLWTPYQQIEVQDLFFPNGELKSSEIRVNHTGYQAIVNLSDDFIARHPGLLQQNPEYIPYNLPFRFVGAKPRVLIVGSGTGNDVAAALRNGSSSIDAVEIDPAILKLGERHPEHPYSDPRVHAHLTDARAFMKRAHGPYDLILFGLLDSHTQMSDYSNMRIDNFVYTVESFREARKLLAPDGVVFVKFQVNHIWLGKRLALMLANTFGTAPTVFFAPSSYGVSASCFVVSNSGNIATEQKDLPLRRFVESKRSAFLDSPPVPLTTDNWPYLYQDQRTIPAVFFVLSLLVIIVATGFYLRIPNARSRMPSLFFFSMGVGFLLLETQVVSRLALYFGTTWQVNGIVIAAVLAALLIANYVTELLRKPVPRSWGLALLVFGILFAYLFPFQRVPGPAASVGVVAALVFSVPVFFAGLLFSAEFRQTDSPATALGANMLGAVLGGLLENASLVFGMKALLVIAAFFYLLAGVGLLRRKTAAVSDRT